MSAAPAILLTLAIITVAFLGIGLSIGGGFVPLAIMVLAVAAAVLATRKP